MRGPNCEKGVDHFTDLDKHRFFKRIQIRESGCWEFTAARTGGTEGTANGYYSFQAQGIRQVAHRICYELLMGRIPFGLELDHLCRNTICVRPTHLEPVSHLINQARGIGFIAKNLAKEKCPQGHDYSNIPDSTGRRQCRTCRVERGLAEYKARTPEYKEWLNARRQERRKARRVNAGGS